MDIFEPPDRKGRAYVSQDQARLEQAQDIMRRALEQPKLDLVQKASGAAAVACYDSNAKLIGTAPPEKVTPVDPKNGLYNALGQLVGVVQADGSTLAVTQPSQPVAKGRRTPVRKAAPSDMTAQQLFAALRRMKATAVSKSVNTAAQRRRLALWGASQYQAMSRAERDKFEAMAEAARKRSAKRGMVQKSAVTPASIAAGKGRLAKTWALARARRS